MKRLLVILAVAICSLALVHTANAQAAFTCSGETLGHPVYYASGAHLDESWSAQCDGAQWKADFYVQYESGGQWFSAGCANTNPCHIRRPADTSSWFANSPVFESGNISFAVLNQCVNYRVRMFLTSKGGVQYGPFTSVKSVCA